MNNKKMTAAMAILTGLLGRAATPGGLRMRRVRVYAPSGAGETEKARRRLQMARGLLSFGSHGRGRD